MCLFYSTHSFGKYIWTRKKCIVILHFQDIVLHTWFAIRSNKLQFYSQIKDWCMHDLNIILRSNGAIVTAIERFNRKRWKKYSKLTNLYNVSKNDCTISIKCVGHLQSGNSLGGLTRTIIVEAFWWISGCCTIRSNPLVMRFNI